MNECEYSGKDFPDITELYKHKYNTHQRSLVLHSHLQPKKESMDVVPYESTKEVVPFDLDKESDSDMNFGRKRKRDDSALDDNHEVKRYRSQPVPDPSRKLVSAAKIREKLHKTKPARKFYQVGDKDKLTGTPEPKTQLLPINENQSEKQVVPADNIAVGNEKVMVGVDQSIEKEDYKMNYERCLAELKDKNEKFKQQISKIRKQCGHDIVKIKKKFKKREQSLRRDLASQKKQYEDTMREIKAFHSNKNNL